MVHDARVAGFSLFGIVEEKTVKIENFSCFPSFIITFVVGKTTTMEPTQKDRIIEEAMRMFVQQGIKSVRMDDIARSLGVSKRTLYEQFGDKEELLALSITRFFEQRRERTVAAAAHAADVLEGLFIALNHILDSTVVSTRMMDNLKKFYPAVHDRVMAEGREKNYRDFRRMLEIGVEEGLFVSDFNFDLAISMLYYTASGLMNHRLEIVPSGMSERDAFAQDRSAISSAASRPARDWSWWTSTSAATPPSGNYAGKLNTRIRKYEKSLFTVALALAFGVGRRTGAAAPAGSRNRRAAGPERESYGQDRRHGGRTLRLREAPDVG